MKKIRSLLLSCALLAGLLVLPASAAAPGYGELSIRVNSPESSAYVTVTISEAARIDPLDEVRSYAVAPGATVTVTPSQDDLSLSLMLTNVESFLYGIPLSGTKQYYLNRDGVLEEKSNAGVDSGNLLAAGQRYTFTVDFTDFMDYAFLTVHQGTSDQNGDSIHLHDAAGSYAQNSLGEYPMPETPEQLGAFTDVTTADYFYAPVKWAMEQGVTAGTSATTFGPHDTCSTSQILTFLWRAFGSQEPTIANPFGDVTEQDYFCKAATWAYEKGLLSGTTLNGNAPCTRAATVTYLWKLAGQPAAAGANFSDVSAEAGYAQAVAWAVEQGITAGTSATTFGPDLTCTRGQIMTFLYADLT